MSSKRHDAYPYRVRAPRRPSLLAPCLAVVAVALGLTLALPSAAQQPPAAAVDHADHTAAHHAAYQHVAPSAHTPQQHAAGAAHEPSASDAAQEPHAAAPASIFLPAVQSSGTVAVPEELTPTPSAAPDEPSVDPAAPDSTAPVTVAAAEPVTWPWIPSCGGNTVPFEAQSWWMNDFGHVHIGFCAPQNQTIRGTRTLDVHPVLFHNPGRLTLLQAQIDSSSTSVGGDSKKIDMTCPITQTCVQHHQLTIDANDFPYSGWHHVRIRATVKEPDGKELVATNFVPVYLDNGKPRKDWTSGMVINGTTDYLAGRGWYTNAEYVWSVFFDPPKASQRISGTHTFKVRPMETHSPKPISYFVVKLDATHTEPGRLLYEHRTTSTNVVEVKLDTRQLRDGWHSIIARTETAGHTGGTCATFCTGTRQTHAGDGKIWFYVDN